MSEDGHKYFFGQMPEMPWKKKEMEMDNEFKSIVVELLACIINLLLLIVANKKPSIEELELTKSSIHRAVEYDRRLG